MILYIFGIIFPGTHVDPKIFIHQTWNLKIQSGFIENNNPNKINGIAKNKP